jgi:hypothetical protein
MDRQQNRATEGKGFLAPWREAAVDGIHQVGGLTMETS